MNSFQIEILLELEHIISFLLEINTSQVNQNKTRSQSKPGKPKLALCLGSNLYQAILYKTIGAKQFEQSNLHKANCTTYFALNKIHKAN